MFDVLGCNVRAAYYGIGAAMDGMKFNCLHTMHNISSKKKTIIKPAKTKSKPVVENVEKKEEPVVEKVVVTEEKTVVPATVINNPTVETSTVVETAKPINVEDIKKEAEVITSALEKRINNDIDHFIEAVSAGKTGGVEKFIDSVITEEKPSRYEIIVKAFMEKSDEDKSFAIYDAVVKNGEEISKCINSGDLQNNALYRVFVENVLGLKLEEVGEDGLDEILSGYPEFEKLFTEATQRALAYIECDKPIAAEATDVKLEDSNKLNLGDNVVESEEVKLKMPISFEDGEATNEEQVPESENNNTSGSKNTKSSSNRKTSNRKR